VSDKPSTGSGDSQETGVRACRARRLGESNLVLCQTGVSFCCWRIMFGEGQLCGHASNQMIVRGALPAGWLTDVSEIS